MRDKKIILLFMLRDCRVTSYPSRESRGTRMNDTTVLAHTPLLFHHELIFSSRGGCSLLRGEGLRFICYIQIRSISVRLMMSTV